MRKIITTFFIFSSCFILVSTVNGQAADNIREVCLKSEHCWDRVPNTCDAHKGNGHYAKLTEKPGYAPLPGKTYIVVCIAGIGPNGGRLCTTGNSAGDLELYKADNFTKMKNNFQYTFHGLFDQAGTHLVTSPVDNFKGPYEWGDAFPVGRIHEWKAINIYDPAKFNFQAIGGQQQGTFAFDADDKDCVKISWDPFGRIFDAGTLEPMGGATVQLNVYSAAQQQYIFFDPSLVPGTINPQTVLEDGAFSFVVPDGDYKLIVANQVADMSPVHFNYSKAYYDIYLANDVIMQRSAIQHRDVPVLTASTSATPKMMQYLETATGNGGIIIEGKVSHPLSKLYANTSKIMTDAPDVKIPYRRAATFFADKLGKFKITIDQNILEETADYTEVFSELEIEKVDLRQNAGTRIQEENVLKKLTRKIISLLIPQTSAATGKTVVKFEPIPQYLDGYAYDAYNKPLPNTTVGIYVTYSNNPYTHTVTDSKGHFIIRPELLPSTSYTIKYTTPTGQIINASTSKFLAQNQKYSLEKGINPYVAEDPHNQEAIIAYERETAGGTGAVTGRGGNSSSSQTLAEGRMGNSYSGGNSSQAGMKPPVRNTMMPILFIIMLLVFMLGGVGVGIFIYIKKNRQVSATPWQ